MLCSIGASFAVEAEAAATCAAASWYSSSSCSPRNTFSPRLREMRPVRTSSTTPNFSIAFWKATICRGQGQWWDDWWTGGAGTMGDGTPALGGAGSSCRPSTPPAPHRLAQRKKSLLRAAASCVRS